MDIRIPPYFTSWLAVVPFLVKFKKAGTKLGKVVIRWIIKTTSTDMMFLSPDAWVGQTAFFQASARRVLLPDNSKHFLGFQGTVIGEVPDLLTLYIVHFPTFPKCNLIRGRMRDCELWQTTWSLGSTGGQYTSPRDSTMKVSSIWTQYGKDLRL